MEKDTIILIAEDDSGHLDLIKRNLRRAGLKNVTREFNDGQEILDFFAGNEFERHKKYLVLLDIRMPKVDGINVLRKLKRSDDTRSIPVIMLTTTDDPKEISICHKEGCNSYITKPVDYEVFVNTITQLAEFLKIIHIPALKAG
ncbi:MAG: response regulator [Planctomycetota bacterium]|jgi:CheY-like chemotaxis protein